MIGSGIIGLSSAFHLLRAGNRVTLIERGACGREASWGNAGWIVPSLIHPFNAPGAVPQALWGMLNPNSPIALRQFPSWSLARWGLAFLRHSSSSRSRESLDALAAMASGATTDVVALAEHLGFEVHRTGLLIPFRSKTALAAHRVAHAEVVAAGYRGRVEELSAAQIAAREPALADDIVGGVYLPDEVSVRPDTMTRALARAVENLWGELAEHETVTAVHHGDRGWRVRTDRRVVPADAVVIAAGGQSAALARTCGVRLPLQSGRGCSVTVPPGLGLRGALKIAEDRIACTPFDGGEVRISGTFDLVRPGAGTSRARMRSVLAAAARTLPGLRDLDLSAIEVWSGARPCTPDSVPLVGPVGPTPGLFAATGHGTLGMTLAVATGRDIAARVTAMNSATLPNIPKGHPIP
ncbi:D-amino acid dehydrogenase small subunit [Rubrobacter xylanophilus DSM 9941] [Mycolicibacterium parafortuitum]|uniref:D-amino acid dehydrogenase small subunit [Rubrobacter xylanophilus DSM 9941] n=1 Tax=Mycolicibacterium parafortuitum TaxID=39692 RepID=A0A375YS52_MYCPF|nr:hypothetical protein BST38_02840 [Mycolicibacterium parafortuitum]SRX84027.1 D-amino acid dehydrogenase small subunit [Rubrobacter xylanophilus DSM 9941] [Mycolicibacterium parafortuitum]